MKRQNRPFSALVALTTRSGSKQAKGQSETSPARRSARARLAPVADLANETRVDDDLVILELPNEGGVPIGSIDENGEGVVMVAPFSRVTHVIRDPNGSGKLTRAEQVFANSDADEIVKNFRSSLRGKTLGVPWYIGHPDHPDFETRDTDIRAYGRIKDLFANGEGLMARVKFSKAGREMVENEEFSGHSPNFRVRRAPDGSYRPIRLKSVGFTNNPKIPGIDPILANEDFPGSPGDIATHKDNQQPMNKIKELLISIGVLKPGAGDDEATLSGGVQALANESKANAEKVIALETELANEKDKRETAETELANEKGKRETAETELANERKRSATPIVDAAIRAGKVIKADRDSTIETLANSEKPLTEAIEDFANEQGIKVESAIGNLGTAKPKDGGEAPSVLELANEKARKFEADGMSPEAAYERGYRLATLELANQNG